MAKRENQSNTASFSLSFLLFSVCLLSKRARREKRIREARQTVTDSQRHPTKRIEAAAEEEEEDGGEIENKNRRKPSQDIHKFLSIGCQPMITLSQ